MNNSTIEMGTTRNSNIELLRLILMFMIIIHHSIVHGLGFSGLGSVEPMYKLLNNTELLITTIINCLCICAVNCFILISGYFGIRTNLRKFLTLTFTIIFYTLIFDSCFLMTEGKYRSALASLLIFSHSNYWFVKCYLYLMAFAPVLNMMFEKLSKQYIYFIITVMLFISCYLGFFWNNELNKTGYSFFQFIMIYCIGRSLKFYNLRITRFKTILLYTLPGILTGFAMYYFWSVGNKEAAIKMTYYNNPLIIISAIGLFLLFSTIRINSKLINRMALSTFAIYLVQSSLWCWSFFYKEINIGYSRSVTEATGIYTMGGGGLIICALSIAVIMFSIIIDQIQKPLNNYFINICIRHFEKLKHNNQLQGDNTIK